MAGHLDSATATRKRRSGAEALEIVGGKISEIRDYDADEVELVYTARRRCMQRSFEIVYRRLSRARQPVGACEMHEQASLSKGTEWPERAIFTVGHSTLPIECFVACCKPMASKPLRTFALCRVRVITRNSTAPRSRMR
jgi:hypothetical protein